MSNSKCASIFVKLFAQQFGAILLIAMLQSCNSLDRATGDSKEAASATLSTSATTSPNHSPAVPAHPTPLSPPTSLSPSLIQIFVQQPGQSGVSVEIDSIGQLRVSTGSSFVVLADIDNATTSQLLTGAHLALVEIQAQSTDTSVCDPGENPQTETSTTVTVFDPAGTNGQKVYEQVGCLTHTWSKTTISGSFGAHVFSLTKFAQAAKALLESFELVHSNAELPHSYGNGPLLRYSGQPNDSSQFISIDWTGHFTRGNSTNNPNLDLRASLVDVIAFYASRFTASPLLPQAGAPALPPGLTLPVQTVDSPRLWQVEVIGLNGISIPIQRFVNLTGTPANFTYPLIGGQTPDGDSIRTLLIHLLVPIQ